MTEALDIAPTAAYADADAGWAEEDELPPRKRNRLVSPLNLLLMAVLVAGGGFVGGVLVEKHEAKNSSTGTGAGGFAALRSAFAGAGAGASSTAGAASTGTGTAGAGTAGAGTAGAGTAGAGAAGAGAGGFAGLRSEFGGGAGGAATSGTVSTVQGHTLYVTDSEGNTIEVKVQSGAKVSKTISTAVAAIHPGDTVVVTGTTGPNGTVAATAVRATAPGVSAGGGGFGLFGGGSTGAPSGGSGTSSGGSGGSSGAPSLFGG